MTTLHDFGGVLEQPLDTSVGLSQFHDHSSWLVCEVALRKKKKEDRSTRTEGEKKEGNDKWREDRFGLVLSGKIVTIFQRCRIY